MADTTLRSRLRRLFSTNVIVRHAGGKKLKIADTNRVQQATRNSLVDRWSRIHTNLTTGGYGHAQAISFQAQRLALFRDYECIDGDTIIPTLDGKNLTIKQLSDKYPNKSMEFYVYSYDHINDTIRVGKAHSVRKTKTEMTYKITLDDGKYIIATANHPFLMRNGEYKRVDELQENDSVMPFYQKMFYDNRYRFVYSFSEKWKCEHKLVSEQFDRKLKDNEVIHHLDFNKENNHPDNLQIMTDSDHKSYHATKINKEKLWSKENYENHKLAMLIGKQEDRKNNPEKYEKIYKEHSTWMHKNNPFRGKNHTEESNIKRSKSLKYFYDTNESKMIGKNNPMYGKKRTVSEIKKMINTMGYDYVSTDDIREKIIDMAKQHEVVLKKDIATEMNMSNTRLHNILKRDGTNFTELKKEIYNTLNHKITSIEKYEVRDVYDMTVEKYHNFATDSCFVHNSMDDDAIISSALDIYADESTLKGEYGQVLEIRSENENINDILHNLYYDILNIEFNLWPWVRNLCKYGDFYLYLDIKDKYGIVNAVPLSAYDVTRIEGEDPENPYMVQFVVEQGDARHSSNMSGQKELENYEIAHFRLLSDSNFLPYGKGMIEGGRKIWKQLSLMEDAMLIHRIMRAPEKRIFKFDIGNIPPAEVDNFMQKVTNKMKKAPVIDQATGDYNLKYNIQNLTEDFFIPVRGGDSGTSIDTLSGLTYEAVDDIEYLRNKLMASLKIPKAFLGYEENVGSKATLAAEDVRFARTIERLQRIITSELTKIGIVHLYAQGYTDQELVNFDLALKNPSTIYEEEKIELWNNKQGLASSLMDSKIADTEWIYDNIFKFTEEEKKDVRLGIIKDQKRKFRWDQIEQEGNDPVQSNEAVGTKGATAGQEGGGQEGGSPFGRTGNELEMEMPDDGWPGSGRPKEGPKHGKDSSVRGRDPLGAHDKRKASSGSPKYGLALAHYDALKKSLGKVGKEDRKILFEAGDVEQEYKNEVSSSLSNGSND